MALLREDDANQLRQIFDDELTGDVTLVHYTQRASRLVVPGAVQCPSCADTEALLGEVAELSGHISLEIHDFAAELPEAGALGIDKIPATVITGPGAAGAVRVFGLPAGYEFGELVEAIIDVGSSASRLADESLAAVSSLTQDVHLQVFVTPT